MDPLVCGGGGSCSATCPTGAVTYDYPDRSDVISRIQILSEAFAQAGGKTPVLLIHDESHGSGLISAMARYSRGRPANVLPLSLYSVTQMGHDALLGAVAAGGGQSLGHHAPTSLAALFLGTRSSPELWPVGPRCRGVVVLGRFWEDFELRDGFGLLANRRTDTIAARIATADHDDVFVLGVDGQIAEGGNRIARDTSVLLR